ncbi:MAG: septum site-determining protein Ssd [Mycobacteriales bacterium]
MTGECRPLVLTADTELLDDVLGAAAAVGTAVDVAVDPASCRPQWMSAPLVLLGGDVAVASASSCLWARPGVLVISRGTPGEKERIGAARVGAEDVVGLPADETVLLERLADVVEPPGRGRVLGILPGRGGAGASVLAAAVALTAASRGDAAWLVDLDPLGGGADAGLGAELEAGARWDDLDSLAGRVSSRALRDALPEICGVAVLSCGVQSQTEPAPGAVRAVLAATRRGGGTAVVDLPRLPSAALHVADEVLLVVPAEVRAVLAARQLVRRLGSSPPGLAVVVRRVGDGLPAHEVARGLGMDLAGDYGDETAVRAALLNGDPRGLVHGTELGALSHRLLDRPGAWARAS